MITLTCKCGSTKLRSVDKLIGTCDITAWDMVQGELHPDFCGETEVCWDGQEPNDPKWPYECGNCGKKYSDKTIKTLLPPAIADKLERA